MRRRWPLRWAPAVMLAASGCAALFSGGPPNLKSPDAGYQYFHNRDFGSPFETGVPYALALAAIDHYPDELGGSRQAFREKFGFVTRPEDPDAPPVGFALHRNGLTGLDFAMTDCSLCHSGRIGGEIIAGLGSRELRLNALNSAVLNVVKRSDFNAKTMVPLARDAAKKYGTPWTWRSSWAIKSAIGRLKERASDETGTAFGGLKDVDAGPGRNTSVEFAKGASHVPVGPPYGFVKYPAVWVYPKRSTFGFDGSIIGDRTMALAAVEFNKGMPANEIIKQRAVWQSVYDYIASLRPPPYSGAVDTALAGQGHEIFQSRCSRCHGTYAYGGEPGVYKEKVVPLHVVGTDSSRLRSVSPALIDARRKGPLAKYVHLEASAGYVAPPLDGIWCRGPYLHNGSVPTLVDLLNPASERPVTFYVGAGTEYDLEHLGLAYQDSLVDGRRAGRRASPRQFLFDTALPGNSSQGHDFGAKLTPDERHAVLEYLKRL